MPWVEVDKAAAPATTITLTGTWDPFTGDPISALASGPNQVAQIVIVAVAALNGGLNTPTFSISVPPGETATWTKITQARGNPTSGIRGRGDIYAIIPETADWVNFSPTITITSITASADPPGWADWVVFEGGTIVSRALDTWFPYLNGGAGESGTSHTLTGAGQPRANDLCIGFSTNRAAAIPGLDPDTTNGSWVSVGAADTGGAVAVQGRLQYKVVTGRGDQTLNPANTQNTVMACLVAQEDWSVAQQGGNIDAVSADPLWQFVSATVPVHENDSIYGSVAFKRWDSTSTTPSLYTKDETKTSGTVNSGGSQSGSVKGESFHKVADGTEGADVVVALTSAGGPTLGVGAILRSKCRWPSASATWLYDTTVGADTDVTGTTGNITADGTIDVQPGDRIKWSLQVATSGTPTSVAPSFPGLTGVNYQIQTSGTITDPDARMVSGYFEVDTGSGAITPAITWVSTLSGKSDGVATFTRERLVIIPLPPIITNCDNNGTADELTLDWVDGGFDPTRYEVRIDGGGWTDVGLVLSHTFTGLAEGSTHTLEVRACNDGGCSASDSTSCTTLSGVPLNLTCGEATQTSVSLCFDPASGNPDYYEIRLDGGTPVTGTSCQAFTDLDIATTYLLEARACINGVGCSEWVGIECTTLAPSIPWSVCPCGPGWRIEVCNLRTGVVHGVLMPTAMDFQVMLNAQGRGTLTLPVRTVRALDVWPDYTSVYITREGMDPANDDCLFAGIVRQATGSNGTVSIGMDSIESYLWRRRLKTDLSFTGVGQNQIMAALVAETVANGIPLTGVAETPGVPRNRDYLEADRVYIGPLIEQFTNSEDGPSWRLEHTRSGGAWSSRIVFADTVGDVRDTVLKSDREGGDYALDLDSQDHATWIDGFNQATPPLTSNANNLSIYPEFDADPTFDTPLQESLDQQTQGALAVRGDIAAVPSFVLMGETIKASQMRLGDTATFHLDHGFIAFHGQARVAGITYRVSQESPLTRELALIPVDTAVESVMNATSTDQCPDCS